MGSLALDSRLLRRLQLTAQRLAGPPARGIVEVVELLRRIQLDPTNAVARSHELVLWSRLGGWDRDELTRLIEDERSLLEFDARLVPTAHWPMIAAAVADAPLGDTKRARESRQWIRDNDRLRRHILDAVGERGPLPTSGFEDVAARDWKSSGWSNAKNVARMLELLARRGELIRAGRRGTERLWELPGHWLSPSTPPPLPLSEALAATIALAVRSTGAAPMPPPSPYSAAPWPFGGLPTADVLAARDRLVDEGVLVPVAVEGMRGDWFLHRDHVASVETLQDDLPGARTTFLSPFDALVSDRDALQQLWAFRYRLEMYVPPAKREWGYYVLPILHHDRFIGRIDPKVDRKTGVLTVHRMYVEDDAPLDATTGAAVAAALSDLASFAGARSVVVHGPLPSPWRKALRRNDAIREDA